LHAARGPNGYSLTVRRCRTVGRSLAHTCICAPVQLGGCVHLFTACIMHNVLPFIMLLMSLIRYSVPATSIAYLRRSPRCSEQCPPPPFAIEWDCCAEHVDLQQIVFDPSVLCYGLVHGLPSALKPPIVCLLAPIHLLPFKRSQSSDRIRFRRPSAHTGTHTPTARALPARRPLNRSARPQAAAAFHARCRARTSKTDRQTADGVDHCAVAAC
jgi:hypothetical protein